MWVEESAAINQNSLQSFKSMKQRSRSLKGYCVLPLRSTGCVFNQSFLQKRKCVRVSEPAGIDMCGITSRKHKMCFLVWHILNVGFLLLVWISFSPPSRETECCLEDLEVFTGKVRYVIWVTEKLTSPIFLFIFLVTCIHTPPATVKVSISEKTNRNSYSSSFKIFLE